MAKKKNKKTRKKRKNKQTGAFNNASSNNGFIMGGLVGAIQAVADAGSDAMKNVKNTNEYGEVTNDTQAQIAAGLDTGLFDPKQSLQALGDDRLSTGEKVASVAVPAVYGMLDVQKQDEEAEERKEKIKRQEWLQALEGTGNLKEFKKGGSTNRLSNKISKLRNEGYPQKQAVAIAYDMLGKNEKSKKRGGIIKGKDGIDNIPFEAQEGSFTMPKKNADKFIKEVGKPILNMDKSDTTVNRKGNGGNQDINVRNEGYPQKQAAAIAYDMLGKNEKSKKRGGIIKGKDGIDNIPFEAQEGSFTIPKKNADKFIKEVGKPILNMDKSDTTVNRKGNGGNQDINVTKGEIYLNPKQVEKLVKSGVNPYTYAPEAQELNNGKQTSGFNDNDPEIKIEKNPNRIGYLKEKNLSRFFNNPFIDKKGELLFKPTEKQKKEAKRKSIDLNEFSSENDNDNNGKMRPPDGGGSESPIDKKGELLFKPTEKQKKEAKRKSIDLNEFSSENDNDNNGKMRPPDGGGSESPPKDKKMSTSDIVKLLGLGQTAYGAYKSLTEEEAVDKSIPFDKDTMQKYFERSQYGLGDKTKAEMKRQTERSYVTAMKKISDSFRASPQAMASVITQSQKNYSDALQKVEVQDEIMKEEKEEKYLASRDRFGNKLFKEYTMDREDYLRNQIAAGETMQAGIANIIGGYEFDEFEEMLSNVNDNSDINFNYSK